MPEEEINFDKIDLCQIVDTQMMLIISIDELSKDTYETIEEDKIKAISKAFTVIDLCNRNLIKLLKEDIKD